jgi:hypothetical protein
MVAGDELKRTMMSNNTSPAEPMIPFELNILDLLVSEIVR